MGPYRTFKIRTVTPSELRAETVLEVGRAPGTSVLFVRTERGLHLLHAAAVPDRRLDEYAVQLAVGWLEAGHTSFETAQNLGIDRKWLQTELERAGYERMSLNDTGPRKGRDSRYRPNRKLTGRGNRRGQQLRRVDQTGASA